MKIIQEMTRFDDSYIYLLSFVTYLSVFNVSEVNHTWARDSGNCVYGWTLSGKKMFNSCRSDSCQTINANKLLPNVKKKPPFLWIDGYVVRSPVMEYYGNKD